MKRFKDYCLEDAPANAAGSGGVAGIGVPAGSKFGEPGVLNGATRKTKKKNRRALGLKEDKDDHKDDELEKCGECHGRGEDWGETCVTCGGSGKIWVSKKTGKWTGYYMLDGVNEERETFAGAPVFEVDTDKWMRSRFGKVPQHRYSRYLGDDAKGEEIRQYGRTQRKDNIILKDQTTGAMTWFLRRKKAGQ